METKAPSYAITGIPTPDSAGEHSIPTRKEITAWYNDKKNNKYEVSLFMRAMTVFKEKPVEDKLSYFQIAGMFVCKTQDNADITRYSLLPSYGLGWCNWSRTPKVENRSRTRLLQS